MITLGGRKLTVEDIERLIFDHESIQLDAQSLKEVEASFDFLRGYAKDKIIYGINTGLGPMAQYKISEQDQHQLQYNLIRSHCSGAGARFSDIHARATMVARLSSLMRAVSGVHPSVVSLLCVLINEKVIPAIFEKGGVGASGDLVQLAHLALNLIGEGEMKLDGEWKPASEILRQKNLSPIQIHIREGLAIMNGTSAMTGIGLVNIIQARRMLNCAVILSSITNEIMKSFDDHFSNELNEVKLHEGQSAIAKAMQQLLGDSKLIRKRPHHLYHQKIEEAVFSDKVQEYYSLRCVPQILGPVYDTLQEVTHVLENELNSANDNPVIDYKSENVHHGGNFHGDYVSLAMDKLKIVMTKLCMLSERQLNYLLNDKLNQKLSPFINLGKLGLNFGLQGMQFTATSTTAENQTLAYPMYLHSISNNNDNQDIVSMGCNAALMTGRVIENTLEVLAIQAIALMQAIDYLKCQTRLAGFTAKVYNEVRTFIPATVEDSTPYQNQKVMREYLMKLGSTNIIQK
jgi:histidine ammonia-lyase